MFSKRLMDMVSGANRYVAAAVFCQWLALLSNIAVMFCLARFTSDFLEGISDTLAAPAFLFGALICVVLRYFCLYFSSKCGLLASIAAKRSVRKLVYEKLVRLGPSYSQNVSTSEALMICVEGCEQLEGYFGSYLPQIFYALLAPVTLFCVLAPVNLLTAGILLACVPLIPLSIGMVMALAARTMKNYWGSYIDLGQCFLENLQGLSTLKIFSADEQRHAQMNREAEIFRGATMKLLRVQLKSVTVMDMCAYGATAIGMCVSLYQYCIGAMPLWAVIAFLLLSVEFFLPMRNLGSYFHTAVNGMAVGEKIFQIMDVSEPQSSSKTLQADSVSLRCENLSFSYDNERKVLDHLDFEARTGSFVGIAGESGSGKSTLAKILTGRICGFEGSVYINDEALENISTKSLSELLTVVPSNAYLFKGTVRDNLLMAKPSADDEELYRVLQSVRLYDFIQDAGGLDMPIQEGASNLSGGQRQRLALARALLHDTLAYIFDEATSNIDVESETAILEVIAKLAETRTVIVITHRLSAIKNASCIYVLQEGKVVDKGRHAQLLEHEGAYRRLWEKQSKLESFSDRLKSRAYSHTDTHSQANNITRQKSTSSSAVREPEISASTVAEGTRGRAFPASDTHSGNESAFALMRRLFLLVRELKGVLLLAVILGVAGFCAASFLSVLAAAALCNLLLNNTADIGALVFVILIALGLIRGPLRWGEQLCNHYLAFRLLAHLRDKVFASLRRLAPAKLEGKDKGELVSLITSDIELLEVFYAHTLSPALIAIIMSLIMIIFIAYHSPLLALYALFCYLAVGVAVPFIASRFSADKAGVLRNKIASINSFVLDSLRGLSEILQFGQSSARVCRLNAEMDELFKTDLSLKGNAGKFSAGTNCLILLLDIVMVMLCSLLIGSTSLSATSAFICTIALMSSFGPVIAIANLGTNLLQTLACGRRVLNILEESPCVEEVDGASPLGSFNGATINDVGFSYTDIAVLKGVNLSVRPGTIIHIGGQSGSGKSTLCKLLMRFWDVDEGTILLNATDIKRINTSDLRNIQAYMTQDTHLFTASIKENLSFVKSDATEEQLNDAIEKASLSDLIERLPDGIETIVGELGESLSGGERQRIGLARMFLHDAPFILLDEPTSNLDSLNEAQILSSLQDARENKTVILVSHRLSTSAIADISYRMEQGKLL